LEQVLWRWVRCIAGAWKRGGTMSNGVGDWSFCNMFVLMLVGLVTIAVETFADTFVLFHLTITCILSKER